MIGAQRNAAAFLVLATAALASMPAAAGFGHMRQQADTFADVSKQFVEAMEAKEGKAFRKLPNLSTRLAKLKDPAALPLMISAVGAENTHYTIFGLGNFGLEEMTGVKYDDAHDGPWWLHWWETNKSKYPAAVRDAALPKFKGYVDLAKLPKVTLQDKILKYCEGHMGQQIGTGLCYELAMAALDYAQAESVSEKDGLNVWGELIYKREIVNGQVREYPDPEAKLKIVPGDIVQYYNDSYDWKAADGGHSQIDHGAGHTGIILEVKEDGTFWKTYDQNMNWSRKVGTCEIQIKGMLSGNLEVYAPKPR